MKTLSEAQKWEKSYPGKVRIRREVRYYAYVEGVQYILAHDWKIEELEQKIWMKEQKKCRKKKQ